MGRHAGGNPAKDNEWQQSLVQPHVICRPELPREIADEKIYCC
jgi:hypothetical protein